MLEKKKERKKDNDDLNCNIRLRGKLERESGFVYEFHMNEEVLGLNHCYLYKFLHYQLVSKLWQKDL